ncbi:MAG: mechanosensitive ion channel protein MscS [Candidatus Cloacimonadota bacterium]|nr:MAG: mechanosensitive ion channel protein MscS [Candidatus Cloacimonadota bacterium]
MNFNEITAFLAKNPPLYQAVKIIFILLSSFLIYYAGRKILINILGLAVLKKKPEWGVILLKNRFFAKVSRLIPLILLYNFSYLFTKALIFTDRVILSAVVVLGLTALDTLLSSIIEIYQTYEISKSKPIKGYVQTVKIAVYILGAITVISFLTGKSPFLLLSGIGAMTAIILLIFRDTILSLVASIQLSGNDILEIGDWISMPKYDADGDVIDIALHTVKVQNFDKTVTMIPTHKFISESFKNWRGMSECGGRRIARSLKIDLNTIRFLDDEDLESLKKNKLIGDFIDELLKNIRPIKEENDKYTPKNITNITLFREYINMFLKNNPKIHKGLTFLVRELEPSENGIPVQIYVFTNDNRWIYYEKIQADIFDHILAMMKEFDLKIFQNPSGNDFKIYRD